MELLRGLFEALGFANFRSFLQSSNIFFDSPETDRPSLASKRIYWRRSEATGLTREKVARLAQQF